MHRAARMLLLGGRPSFEPEALALFARMSSPPASDRAVLINALIKSLKTDGVWAKLDALYLLAAAETQVSRLNWIGGVHDLSAVNGPTFALDRGYTGNGASAYLDTGFVPSAAVGSQYALNSASAAVWCRTAATDVGAAIGTISARSMEIYPRFTDSNAYARANTLVNLTASAPSGVGLYHINRTASNATQLYKNGVLAASSAAASSSLPNSAIAFLRSTATYSYSGEVAAGWFGASLTGAEAAAMYAAINTYLTAIGAA